MLMRHYRTSRTGRPPPRIAVPRQRLSSRLTVWLFAGALLLKSAVPMLASAAASLRGTGVADVCDVYGVATVAISEAHAHALAAPPSHLHTHSRAHQVAVGHAYTHAHGGAEAHDPAHDATSATAQRVAEEALAPAAAPAPADHGDRHRSAHGADHCVLTGMVALASDAPTLAPLQATRAIESAAAPDRATPHDAAARWATLLEHGPPHRA
jgi:hypothetical protein